MMMMMGESKRGRKGRTDARQFRQPWSARSWLLNPVDVTYSPPRRRLISRLRNTQKWTADG